MRKAPIFFVCLAALFAIKLFAQKPAPLPGDATQLRVDGPSIQLAPGAADAPAELVVGKPVPDFTLPSLGDEMVTLSDRFAGEHDHGDDHDGRTDPAQPPANDTDTADAPTDEVDQHGKPVVLLFSRANW